MTSVGTAELQIVPSFKGGYKSLSKQYGPVSERSGKESGGLFGRGMQSGIGGMATKIFAPLAAAAGGVALGSFLKGAVDQASDLNEVGTALTQVFGKDGVKAIDEFAAGGAKAFGQNELAIKNAAQTFGIYGKAAGLASGENVKFSSDLVGLSTDLASFYNADPSEVVDALGAGLRGEAEPLRRFGILMDDASLKAAAMEQGIYDGEGALSQQQKVLAAQSLIMSQTADAQGDFAKTSGGLANQQRILSATWENFTGVIGAKLLPHVTEFFSFLTDNAGPVLDWLSDKFSAGVNFLDEWLNGFKSVRSVGDFFTTMQGTIESAIGEILNWLPGAISTFVPIMVEGMVSRYTMLATALTGIVTSITTLLPTLLPTLLTGAVQLFQGLVTAVTTIVPMLLNTVLSLLPMLVTTLLGMLPLLVEAAISLFMSLVQAVTMIIPTLIETLVALLPVILESLISLLPALIDGALQLFMAIVTALPIIIPALIRAVVDLLPVLISSLLGLIPELIDGAIELFTGIVEAIPEIVPDLVGAIVGLLPDIVGAILGLVPDLFQAGKDLIGGLISGVGSMGSALWDSVKSIASSALDGIKGFFGIHSPSTVFAGIGVNLGEGLVRGVDKMADPVQDAMLAMTQPPALAASFRTSGSAASSIEPGSALTTATGRATTETIILNVDGRELTRVVRNADRRVA